MGHSNGHVAKPENHTPNFFNSHCFSAANGKYIGHWTNYRERTVKILFDLFKNAEKNGNYNKPTYQVNRESTDKDTIYPYIWLHSAALNSSAELDRLKGGSKLKPITSSYYPWYLA